MVKWSIEIVFQPVGSKGGLADVVSPCWRVAPPPCAYDAIGIDTAARPGACKSGRLVIVPRSNCENSLLNASLMEALPRAEGGGWGWVVSDCSILRSIVRVSSSPALPSRRSPEGNRYARPESLIPSRRADHG